MFFILITCDSATKQCRTSTMTWCPSTTNSFSLLDRTTDGSVTGIVSGNRCPVFPQAFHCWTFIEFTNKLDNSLISLNLTVMKIKSRFYFWTTSIMYPWFELFHLSLGLVQFHWLLLTGIFIGTKTRQILQHEPFSWKLHS